MAKVELNYAGFNEYRHSPEIAEIIAELTNGIAERAGDGYEAVVRDKPTRVTGFVYAATEEAKRDQLENNTLLKAVDG